MKYLELKVTLAKKSPKNILCKKSIFRNSPDDTILQFLFCN